MFTGTRASSIMLRNFSCNASFNAHQRYVYVTLIRALGVASVDVPRDLQQILFQRSLLTVTEFTSSPLLSDTTLESSRTLHRFD